MELKYFAFVPAGAVICVLAVIMFIFYKRKAKGFTKGVKIANIDLLFCDSQISRRMIAYVILRILLIMCAVISIMASFILLARPYYIKKTKEAKYNRDIMICLDVSTSVDELNKKLVKDLKKMVLDLSGERIGIVIFNTTPVLLSPLTDDYEYVIEQLDNVGTAIKAMNDNNGFYNHNDWLYWDNFLYGGTLIGNSERGSSLIGDGLLGALFNFPEESSDRTKIIVFSTDNEPNGEGYVTLPEAAQYCKDSNVYVYGIGTKEMYERNLLEMKAAVELTKGKFYLEESAYTFHNIVEEIESLSAGLVEGRTIIRMVESPETVFIVLCVSFLLLVIVSLILKRVNIFFLIVEPLVIISLIVSFLYVIVPAKRAQSDSFFDIKKESNLNVLFVIDDTISMLADDMDGGYTRLTKVKEDCNYIIDELDGAYFSVISFNNSGQILTPFNNNSGHVKNIISAIYPLDEFYAKGSSLNTPKNAMLSSLTKAHNENKNKTAVFFISDGEITDGSTLESYVELSELIDFGAVLGYGTDYGGTMTMMKYWMDEPQQIMDYSSFPLVPARSVIDEKNLKKLANDMGIAYENMTDENDLSPLLSKIKSNITVSEEKTERSDSNDTLTIDVPENKWYFMFAVIALLMICNAGYIALRK